jgi:hypothetical protein
MEKKQGFFFTYPLKQAVYKLFLPGVISERSEHCLFCGGTPSIGCLFTLKPIEFIVFAL